MAQSLDKGLVVGGKEDGSRFGEWMCLRGIAAPAVYVAIIVINIIII